MSFIVMKFYRSLRFEDFWWMQINTSGFIYPRRQINHVVTVVTLAKFDDSTQAINREGVENVQLLL
jgi:hypothetical protein